MKERLSNSRSRALIKPNLLIFHVFHSRIDDISASASVLLPAPLGDHSRFMWEMPFHVRS